MLQDKGKVMFFVRQMSTFTPFCEDGWGTVNREKTVSAWMGHREQREKLVHGWGTVNREKTVSTWMGNSQQGEVS